MCFLCLTLYFVVMENNILCSSPRIILNPLAGEMISRFGCYVLNGKEYKINKKLGYYDKTVKLLKPRFVRVEDAAVSSDCFDSFYNRGFSSLPGTGFDRTYKLRSKTVCNITDEVIDNSYFYNPADGECFPMYFKVRCGHCVNCKKSKTYSLIQRLKMESVMYKCNPIFLTLTYDEAHKPKEGVNVRDVQLFLKRLRINLQRHGYTDKIRYFFVSEYGTKTSRPHYHGIIWNLHQSDMVSYRSIGEIIKKSWNNGFEMHRQVDMRDDKAFFYTSKYVGKDSHVPDGQNQTFMVSSNRGGAIGALLLASIAPEVRRSMNIEPKYLNSFTGHVESLSLDKFVLDRLFPSINRQLTSPIRTAVKRFVLNFASLRTYELEDRDVLNAFDFDKQCSDIIEYFSRYMYIYSPETVSIHYLKPYNQLLRELDEDYIVLSRFMARFFVYDGDDDAEMVSIKRGTYISKLLNKKMPQVDLVSRAREWTRLTEYLQQFEIF